MKGMILAAGFGTRLRPITGTLPKALIPVAGRPMIAHAIDTLVNAGISEIVVNVHAHADQVIAWIAQSSFSVPVRTSREETILGTGGGIRHARELLRDDGPFLVHNVDIVSGADLRRLIEAHRAEAPLATLAVNRRKSTRPILAGAGSRFIGKKIWFDSGELSLPAEAAEEFGFCGISVLDQNMFHYLADEFSDIFDALRSATQEGGTILCHDIGSAYWTDLGTEEAIRRHESRIHGHIPPEVHGAP
jgi:NDP-sugar pyrophosphorylase family protein